MKLVKQVTWSPSAPQRMLSVLCLAATVASSVGSARSENLSTLAGTWSLVSAYEIQPDGTRTTNYGERPTGLLMVDGSGRYSIQIFKLGRPLFTSGDKTVGTPDEYRSALVGISTHIGNVTIDRSRHQLVFDVQAASFPNWEGKRQVRDFTYQDGVLSYAVPPTASGNGATAYSVWRRVDSTHPAASMEPAADSLSLRLKRAPLGLLN
jgi:hypothetical protein